MAQASDVQSSPFNILPQMHQSLANASAKAPLQATLNFARLPTAVPAATIRFPPPGLPPVPPRVLIPKTRPAPTEPVQKAETGLAPKALVQGTATADPSSKAWKVAAVEGVAGWFGGAFGILVTHPLDTVRVNAQFKGKAGKVSYYSMVTGMYRSLGVGGFYRGVMPPMVFRGVGMGVNRLAFNVGERLWGRDPTGDVRAQATIGAFAGVCKCFTELPTFLIKTRVQIKPTKKPESFALYWELVKKIWKFEGRRAFTNGYVPLVLTVGPSCALFYVVYDWTTEHMKRRGWSAQAAGAGGGILGALSFWPFFYPMDTLRTRMQLMPYHVPMRRVAQEMWRQPLAQWWCGILPGVIRTIPRWGCTMFMVETCKSMGMKWV